MRWRWGHAGFGALAVVIIVVVLAVIGLAGFTVWKLQSAASEVDDAPTYKVVVPDHIKTTGDLQTTDKALDESGGQLDASLDDGSLDADLQSLL